jgi:membrane protease subunit HflK
VDEVITTGKGEIQAEIREKLSNRLEADDIGLQLINITIQDSEPPTEIVKDAFKNVETARQGKETKINEARKYESEQVPAARAQVDAIQKEADTRKQVRINEAYAQVAVFNAMFAEYQKNPLMTRRRMYFEAMEEILPGMKIVIDDGDGATSKVLPLESFVN